jgi:hypothetical protein
VSVNVPPQVGSLALDAKAKIEYVHTLVFRCPRCNCPIALVSLESTNNYGSIGGRLCKLTCPCAWFGERLILEARYHWVGVGWNDDSVRY